MNTLEQSKLELIAGIEKRVSEKIIEKSNADLLIKLINNAESLTEAISIAELGTTYKRTGLHFDKRLEKFNDTIKYFSKNNELSFKTDDNAITHKLIIGDNYDALLNLLVSYRGMINVIYIDPPYGKDSMGEFADTNYDNNINRDNLLSMLYSRLLLARELLSENGFIFISIDDRNEAYIKCLCDEVFSEINFRSLITVVANPGGRDYGGIAKTTEFVLVYSKEPEPMLVKIESDEHNFILQDAFGKFELRELRNRNTKFNDGNRPNLCYPFYVDEDDIDENGLYNISLEKDDKHKITVMPLKSQGIQTVWRWGKEEKARANLNINIKAKKKQDGSYMIVEKYRDERIMVKNLFSDKCYRTENGSLELKSIFNDKLFDYPKPIEIPQTLINTIENKNAIVLDFFSGSGTTGQAVLELNKLDGGHRQYICVQLPENLDQALQNNPNNQTLKNQIMLCDKYNRPHLLSEVTAERLRRIMTGKCYDNSIDFDWIQKNKPYGDNLDVYEIKSIANFENTAGKTPFDVIDETLYGKEKFNSIKDKVDWVCSNFEGTQKVLESDEKWKKRMEDK